MFRHCVWFLIKENHGINKNIVSYASLLNTPTFNGHVTIQSGLSREEAEEVCERFREAPKPFFSPHGYPKISKTKFQNAYRTRELDFYAIEQPLNTNGIYVDEIHVSLAYSINRPITQMELAMAPYTERIYDTDIDVVVANCRSENPSYWYVEDF